MNFSFRRIFVLLITLCLVIVNVAAFFIYRQSEKVTDARNWVTHTNQVIEQTFLVFYTLQDSLTSQRGYVLTGNKEFLDNYQRSVKQLELGIAALQDLTGDNEHQQGRLDLLKSLIGEEKSLMENGIYLRATDNAAALASIDDTRKVMDKIRILKNGILDEEKRLLSIRSDTQERNQQNFFLTLLATSGISIFVLLAANALILYFSGKQRTAEASLAAAEKDLQLTNERMELALEATSDGLFDWNVETGKLFLSRRFLKMVGYDREDHEITIEEFKRFIHPDDYETVWDELGKAMNGEDERFAYTARMQHKEGSWRWHLVRGVALRDAGGKVYRLVAAHSDITEMKALEEGLKASNKELEEFTYIASHDLRSPLVNLKGFASELSMAVDSLKVPVEAGLPLVSEQERQNAELAMKKEIPLALQFIHSSVGRMDKLTNAILELSRIGRRELRFEKVNVGEVVKNCLNTLRHQIDTKNITVEVGHLPDATADPVALEQVFGNVIDNAVKYLDPARPGRIQISGSRYASETVYRVSDNGRGIAPEDMAKIFEIFRRAGNNRDIPGEGMGMAYIKAMLRRHGGDIYCQSELGKGTTFYFSIAHQLEKGQTTNG